MERNYLRRQKYRPLDDSTEKTTTEEVKKEKVPLLKKFQEYFNLEKISQKGKLISFKNVDSEDLGFIWSMYCMRDTESLSEPPNYQDEIKFVSRYGRKDHYFKNWKIILFEGAPIGQITISRNNTIGYWLLPAFQDKGLGAISMERFLQEYNYDKRTAIIHHKNGRSKHFAKKFGFDIVIKYDGM